MHSITIPYLQVDSDEWVDKIFLRRGEGGLATIDTTLMNNGTPYDLTGCSVLFLAYDPNEKVIYEPVNITSQKDGKVSYTVSKSLTNMYGDIRVAYFRIQNGDDTITTGNIPIIVRDNVDLNDEQAGEYESQFENLLKGVQDLMAEVGDALGETRTATKNANDAAKAANDANSNISKAEAGRVSNESQRQLNETARQKAAEEAAAAEEQRKQDEDAREQAEQARQAAETERVEEWESLKDEAETATTNAQDAADLANEAANNADSSAQNADEAAEKANKAVERVDDAVKLANDAAGDATVAASLANAATDKANEAIDDMADAMAAFNSIVGTDITYSYSDSSTVPPTDGWTASQKPVPQGMFQWIKTVTHYRQGNPTVAYSVAHQGVDGRDGIGAMTSSLFWLWVDEKGDLYAEYTESDKAPVFDYNPENGNLYYVLD